MINIGELQQIPDRYGRTRKWCGACGVDYQNIGIFVQPLVILSEFFSECWMSDDGDIYLKDSLSDPGHSSFTPTLNAVS